MKRVQLYHYRLLTGLGALPVASLVHPGTNLEDLGLFFPERKAKAFKACCPVDKGGYRKRRQVGQKPAMIELYPEKAV